MVEARKLLEKYYNLYEEIGFSDYGIKSVKNIINKELFRRRDDLDFEFRKEISALSDQEFLELVKEAFHD